MSADWHLAIESSGLGGSVALFYQVRLGEGELHSQQILPAQQGSVRTLAPAIDALLRNARLQPHQLTSLSVTQGPGSFTGLRVGLATAKMLAWVGQIPVVPVDTLQAIALRSLQSAARTTQLDQGPCRLVSAINAFRKQVFTSSWLVRPDGLECRLPASVVNADQWLSDPWQVDNENDDLPLWIGGSALQSYAGIDTDHCHLVDASLWQPLAEQVGQLGLQGLAEGRAVTAEQLVPNYIRSSAAEENARR